MRSHDIALADGQVAATVVAADRPSGAGVLFVHGLGSDRRTNIERAQALAASGGTTCVAIDLRGHGDSSGRLTQVTPRENLADVVAGFDALQGMADVEPSRVGVCGASYGAYLSVLVSGERTVARLLLRAPALYADDSLVAVLSGRRAGSTADSPAFVHALRALPMPILLVESEQDEVISPAIVATYLAAQPAIDRVVLPGAGHALTDPAWRPEFQRLVTDYFGAL